MKVDYVNLVDECDGCVGIASVGCGVGDAVPPSVDSVGSGDLWGPVSGVSVQAAAKRRSRKGSARVRRKKKR